MVRMEWNECSGFVEKRDPDQMDGRYEFVGWVEWSEREAQGKGEREKRAKARGTRAEASQGELFEGVEVIVMRMMSGGDEIWCQGDSANDE